MSASLSPPPRVLQPQLRFRTLILLIIFQLEHLPQPSVLSGGIDTRILVHSSKRFGDSFTAPAVHYPFAQQSTISVAKDPHTKIRVCLAQVFHILGDFF